MTGEVILLDYRFSPPTMRVRVALKEKGIAYESKEQDLFNKSSLLLEMNPVHKQVPVLIHNGKPICESLIIVEYIDEVWNDKSPVLPSDPYARAQARFWADFVDKKAYPAGKALWMTKGEPHAEAKKELISSLKVLETELGDKTYFGGESFGIIDIALVPCCILFHTFEKFGTFSASDVCPKLFTWGERCLKRESVSTGLPSQSETCDFISGLVKRIGIE
ncbi:hypothetical protein ACH5RR_037446 [Cinchona calisaya]|uniref:Glutathione S-transferase n=1 Tax=Cinchona calisaya TaxID=153742 RepID=A0ABD2YAW8_9GENT